MSVTGPRELHRQVLAAITAAEGARPGDLALPVAGDIVHRHEPTHDAADAVCSNGCAGPWPCADYLSGCRLVQQIPTDVADALGLPERWQGRLVWMTRTALRGAVGTCDAAGHVGAGQIYQSTRPCIDCAAAAVAAYLFRDSSLLAAASD